MENALNVVVLYNEGCPATPKTVQLVEECVSEMGFHAEIRKILVDSREKANQWRFLGSPTVQINGVDIDPSVREEKVFGFT